MISNQQKMDYENNGFLILENFINPHICELLKTRAKELISDFNPRDHKISFSAANQSHAKHRYFLDSAEKIHFFFEENVFDEKGELKKDKQLSINKIGHALHDIDPVFDCFSRQHNIAKLISDLGINNPLLLQSMYICKQPFIGGEVDCHQDSTFIHVEGEPTIGLWFALEDATLENGCLWAIPGGHRTPLKSRYLHRGKEVITEVYDSSPWEIEKMVALPVKQGSLIVLHGLSPHMSYDNTSPISRHAYTLHIISADHQYSNENWLQRSAEMPLRGFV